MDTGSKRPFSWKDNLAYAAGDFGCNMSFTLKSTLVIFWTQYMGMNSIVYAGLLLIVQIWDAINDPIIGALIDADRRSYRRGKFLAYISAGSLGLIVGGALCFIPIPGAPGWVKNIIFVSGYVLWDAFYTVANVPYGSLLSLISDDAGDRASLSAWRSIGSLVGQMLTMVLIPVLIYDSRQNILGMRVFFLALIMGLIGFAALQYMIRATEIRADADIHLSEDRPKFRITRALRNFVKNRAAMGATVAAMGMFLGTHGSTAAVTVLFQSYFSNVRISGLVSMFSLLPVLFFTPFIRKLVGRYGKKELSAFGAACSCFACLLMLTLPITPDDTGVAIYALCQLLNSLGMGVYTTVSWSLMGDAIDYNQWKYGVREEGTVYSIHSFFRKLAQGLGPSLVLVIMVMLGYVEADEGHQAFHVARNMRYLVAGLYSVSAVIQLIGLGAIYNLDRHTVMRMQSDLKKSKTDSIQNIKD